MRGQMSPCSLKKVVVSCKVCCLLGNCCLVFCICASNEPCQYSSTDVTLSATVFDRLHCKEAACNSLFVPVYILDHLLVTLFLFWSEYIIDNFIFIEMTLFPASQDKFNQYLYFIQMKMINIFTHLTLYQIALLSLLYKSGMFSITSSLLM